MSIPAGSEINLWFEDDLFCQVNFWFVCSLLQNHSENCSINYVRPEVHTRFGFGGLSEADLLALFNNRKKLTQIKRLAELWTLYQHQSTSDMLAIG